MGDYVLDRYPSPTLSFPMRTPTSVGNRKRMGSVGVGKMMAKKVVIAVL